MKKIVINIQDHTIEYIKKAGLKSLVLGVSGGIDSALIAAIMYPICNTLKIPLYGLSLPQDTNEPEEIERARAICDNFCTKWTEYDIGADFTELKEGGSIILNNLKIGDSAVGLMQRAILAGNIKARIRMIHLYTVAGATKGMVLSTDNWTELMLGFWTLHGDVGDYGAIQNLTKTEVYEMAEVILKELQDFGAPSAAQALRDCINAIPTDGLGVSNSDFDQLGAGSYQEIDEILQAYKYLTRDGIILSVKEKLDLQDLREHLVIKRHINSEFKRNNPYNIPRDILWKDV